MVNGKSLKIKKVVFFNLCLLAVLAGLWRLVPDFTRTVNWSNLFDAGENWIFALTGTFDNFWFPFYPVVISVIQYHTPVWLQAGAYKFVFLLPVILAFSAGSLIHSFSAGILSAALSAVLGALLFMYGGISYEWHFEQVLIAAALLMLVCGFTVKFRSYALRSCFIGLLLAVALYAKGVIVLFAPALLAYEAYNEPGGRSFSKQWPAISIFLAGILVWQFVNWVSGNGFVFLESSNRSDDNIITGAMGFISTVEGDTRALAGITSGQHMFLWAIREVLSHPFRYIYAVIMRLDFLLSVKPIIPGLGWLSLLWLAGVLRLRRLAPVRPLLLLTLYLLLIHLLMPVEGRYFIPMWFLVCTLTVIFLADMLGGAAKPGGYEYVNAKAVFYAASAPVIVFWAFSFILLILYPLRSKAAHDLGKLETEYPGVPWLHEMAAHDALRAGDFDKAAQSYRKAEEIAPIYSSRKAGYLKTVFKAGKISGAQLQEHFQNFREYHTLMLAALRYGEEGQLAKAEKILPCALQLCVRNSFGMRYVADSMDGFLLKKMRRYGAESCLGYLSGLISTLDARRRGVLLDRLAQIDPGLWRPELLFSAFEEGNRAEDMRAVPRGARVKQKGLPEIAACLGVFPQGNHPGPGSPRAR